MNLIGGRQYIKTFEYEQGSKAKKEGIDRSENPHPNEWSVAWERWDRGWFESN